MSDYRRLDTCNYKPPKVGINPNTLCSRAGSCSAVPTSQDETGSTFTYTFDRLLAVSIYYALGHYSHLHATPRDYTEIGKGFVDE